MPDYANYKKEAQIFFSEMLDVCKKRIKGFEELNIDPVLYFKTDITAHGSFRRTEGVGQIRLHYVALPSCKYVWREIFAHEIAHAIAYQKKHYKHGKIFQDACRQMDEIFGTKCCCVDPIEAEMVKEGLLEFDPDLYDRYIAYREKKAKRHQQTIDKRKRESRG